MAILKDLPGVTVTVVSDDAPLKEYEDREIEEEEGTVTRYIEAVSGKNFAIKIEVAKGTLFKGNSMAFECWVDGEEVDIPLVSKSREDRVRFSEGKMASKYSVQKYCFSAIETVSDGHTVTGEAAKVKSLGSIEIRAHHMKKTRMSPTKPSMSVTGSAQPGLGIVSEKALKGQALSHSVSFSRATHHRSKTYYDATFVEDRSRPAGIFLFHYRALHTLKSMLIIPRTPTPPPLSQRDLRTLNEEEMQEALRRLQAFEEQQRQQENKVKVKRERLDNNPRPRKIARPMQGSTQLEIDAHGASFREASTSTLSAPEEKEVIELD